MRCRMWHTGMAGCAGMRQDPTSRWAACGAQVWLVATGQTTWEHAQRGRVVYLHHLPDGVRPFDAGLGANSAFLHGDLERAWEL